MTEFSDYITIVSANGSILTTNETENANLFWGIRGGTPGKMQLWRCYAIHIQAPSSATNGLFEICIYPADTLEQLEVIKLRYVVAKWWTEGDIQVDDRFNLYASPPDDRMIVRIFL